MEYQRVLLIITTRYAISPADILYQQDGDILYQLMFYIASSYYIITISYSISLTDFLYQHAVFHIIIRSFLPGIKQLIILK